MKLAQRVSRGVYGCGRLCRRSMLFLTAIGVYAFLKLLAEVVMLLLFLLCYYAGECVVFCFYVG